MANALVEKGGRKRGCMDDAQDEDKHRRSELPVHDKCGETRAMTSGLVGPYLPLVRSGDRVTLNICSGGNCPSTRNPPQSLL